MKRLFAVIIIFFFFSNVISQTFENEWIKSDQHYYRIPIIKTGIYRIYKNDLISANIPEDSFDPQHIQIFYKGVEQAIFVKQVTGILDYVEFFAERNDGWFDTALYVTPNEQTNPFYSLINDTSSYYFTWNNSFDNKRLLETDYNNFDDYSALDYCFFDTVVLYTSGYYYGITDPEYTSGEGWFDNQMLSIGSSINKTIITNNVYSGGPDAALYFAIVGISSGKHHLSISENDNLLIAHIYTGRVNYKDTLSLDPNVLNNNLSLSFSSIDDQGEAADNSTLSYIKIKYPKTFNFGNRNSVSFLLPESADTIQLIEFTGIDENPVLIYNIQKQTRSFSDKTAGIHKALILRSNTENKIIIYKPDSILTTENIQKINFIDYSTNFLNQEFIIISNSFIWNQALSYAAYRNAVVVNVEELYHQFAYGITKHPLSIRNFLNYIYQESESKPEYLLLLGKAIQAHNMRNDADLFENCLVPTYGNPPSDNLFTAGLEESVYDPLIQTGRIAATGNAEVRYYLDKVKEYEIAEPGEWMKQILHFGGGVSASEQQTLANYLAGFEAIIEDTLFGGFVSTFLKNSSEPIVITISDTIKNLINTGTSMLTFFGHAAASGFDQNIDDPSAYDNKGKYPFLLANSCYSGNIHTTSSESVSERWVLIPDKGVIGFLASTYLANASDLKNYSTELYKNISYKNYNQSIGKCIQQTIRDYVAGDIDNITIKNTSLQFTLHGDPSIKINSHTLPDLKISAASFFTFPQNITTELDSFDIYIVVTNIGKAIVDTFAVNLTRIFSDGSTELFYDLISNNYYKDTLTFRIDVNRIKGSGLNRFEVFVDANNMIIELNEFNNTYQTDIFIRTNDLSPVYPYNQSMYPDDSVTLIVSTGDPFNEQQQSVFQLDTNTSYNSPAEEFIIDHKGGVVKWNLQEQLEPDQVYFWRVSKIPENGEFNWNSSSFTYIPGKTGWSQSHYKQFEKNTFHSINYNESENEFEFIKTAKKLHCHNIGSPSPIDLYHIQYTIDGSGDYTSCGAAAKMHIVIIDSFTITPWLSEDYNFNQMNYPNCYVGRTDKYFLFKSDEQESRMNMANMINDSVPEGNYILAYSFIRGNFSQWEDYTYNAFENLGASEIRNVPDSFPYIFFAKKGYINTAQEVIGRTHYDEIDLYADMFNNYYYGKIVSPLIGPSSGWDKLSWGQHSVEEVNTDSVKLSVTGILSNGEQQILYDNLGILDYEIDLSMVNSGTYPYLQLNFFTQDIDNHTPAQLDYWQIEYTGVTELAIDPSTHYAFNNDTIEEGEQVQFSIAINNISPYNSDSINVNYWLYDNELNYISLDASRTPPLMAGDFIIDTIEFSSMGIVGRNQLWIEINPVLSSGNYGQQEQYHFNNIAEKDFYVEPDKTNPILDVTFDRVHIMNGDIISAHPEILITLTDENKYIPLNDTSLFTLFLTSAGEGEKRIYFTDNMGIEALNWIPANLPENSFKIIYNPVFEKDGIYELKVQAKDQTGNYSGDFDYRISFEIINKSTITNIYNYPNPFSTSTRFVFELTGSEVPDDFRIQIMTITGKLVKEIDLHESGSIHIGKNITEYAWDGTDMFGDRLANGLYFYRVYAKLYGKKIEHRSSGGDDYFQKGFGKMYLIR